MKADFAGRLRCPVCRHDGTLELNAEVSDEREVREGRLRCRACLVKDKIGSKFDFWSLGHTRPTARV